MQIEIAEEPASFLAEYARIPISFEVDRFFEVAAGETPGEFILTERAVRAPSVKDYDAVQENAPILLQGRFDLSKWGVFSARVAGQIVAGAIVAFPSSDIGMLDERDDLALLWDIRVAPDARRKAIGSALLQAVKKWALARGATRLEVETQNINVPACRFYKRHGFVLRAANEGAYRDFPDEIQLFWYKDLV